jgi:pantoate--beta-alanine ligase
MNVVKGVSEMKALSRSLRKEGKTIAFVPTMGALHDGHLSLMAEGKKRADALVSSVFVNPAQFGPNEDYKKYTRDTEGDLAGMRRAGVDVAFFPEPEEIYPPGSQTYVEVKELQKPLCGASRPGHFRGVATVVLKLFNIVKPDFAIFGKKDYQQLQVIKRMVRDLDLDVEIIGMPTWRESSGLAMSSRNTYLSEEERERAVSLSKALGEIKRNFDGWERDAAALVEHGRRVILNASAGEIDYLEIRKGETLEEVKSVSPGDVAALAVKVGGARLIDNIEL